MNRLIGIVSVFMIGAALTGCASDSLVFTQPTPDPTQDGFSAYPTSYKACGQQQELAALPEKVLALDDSLIPAMVDLGIHDRLVGMPTTLPKGAYSPEAEKQLADLPPMGDLVGDQGMNLEAVKAAQPDFVIGAEAHMDYAALHDGGIAAFTHEGDCSDLSDFETYPDKIFGLYDELGALFNMKSRAAEARAYYEPKVTALKEAAAGTGQTVAIVRINAGPQNLSTYGNASMATTVADLAGLKNAFHDRPDRIIPITVEDLNKVNPEFIMLVGDGDLDTDALQDAFLAIEGAAELNAVEAKKIGAMPELWADRISSLNLKGVEALNKLVKSS